MKTRFQFRSRLAAREELLTQQATFLPIEIPRLVQAGAIYTQEMEHLTGFLPVFKLNRKNLTVAQPLLKEDLR